MPAWFGAPLIVLLFLKITRDRRIERFGLQLPDAIDVFVRGLRVGHPLSKALEIVSREMSDPIGSECGITADEMTFGQDFVTAINNLYRRVGQDDLMFLVVAISVQSQTGGNLADVLTRLSKLIRGRLLLTNEGEIVERGRPDVGAFSDGDAIRSIRRGAVHVA